MPLLPRLALLLALLVAATSCSEPSHTFNRFPTELPPWVPDIDPIIHTRDGQNLRFTAGSFQPSHIEHCRTDGRAYLTSIFELRRIQPMGSRSSLCEGSSGTVLGLYLVFVDRPAEKVTTHCPEGCVVPGGYYPPLGTVVFIPWSEISYIELRAQ